MSTLGLKRCPLPDFEPKPDLSKTLESLLMQFVNTILPLNSLNITIFVYYVSWSKVNRKERSRPLLFVCFFVLPCKINQSRSIWFRRVSVMSWVWNRPRKSVWISMITGITTAPSIKVLVPFLGYFMILFCGAREFLFVCLFVIMWDEFCYPTQIK